MVGVAAVAADKPDAGAAPGTLAFDLDSAQYRFELGLCVLFILAVSLAMIVFRDGGYLVTIPLAAVLVVLGLGLGSSVRTCMLVDPVLVIDHDGILDQRVTRAVVPWAKIRNVALREFNNREAALPSSFAVWIDVGSRRRAGIALAPWYWHSLGWDDIVISVQGLAGTPDSDEAAVAKRIADHARAMLARHRRAAQEPFAG